MPSNVGVAYVEVRPDLTGFGREMRTGMGRQMKAIGDDSAKALNASFAGAAKSAAASFGVAFGAIQIKNFIASSIQAASDLQESFSKVGVVFDDQAVKVRAFAKGAADAIGQSEQQALEATGTFGNLFVAMGIGGSAAADMSIQLVKLASDLASFNNVSPEDALLALRAGLVGETEPLRRFGVNLNEATLKQKALQLGLKATGTTLDASTKAQAAYALIFEQTTTAQGDFARTSENLANQQRTLAAQWTDAKAALGEGLLPAMTSAVKFINDDLLPALRLLFDPSNPENNPHTWAAAVHDAVGDAFGFMGDIMEQALRNLAALIDALPTNFGKGVAADIREVADNLGTFNDKMHASIGEMQGWAGAVRNAEAAAKLLAGSSKQASNSVTALGTATAGASKEARDAAKADRDLAAAQRDYDKLLKDGPVNEEKLADARERLADATRSLESANRNLNKAQRDYADALAAAALNPSDTNLDALQDASDSLADAKDGVADATARQKDAEKELKQAQAGDPDYQDKLADARDRLANAQDKVNTNEGIGIGNTGKVVAGINARTEAMMALNREWKIASDNPGIIDDVGNILGAAGKPIAPTPTVMTSGSFGPGSIFGGMPTVSMPTMPTSVTNNNVTVNVTQPVPDPGLIGKQVAWAL